jgi:hypothetical protein
MIKKKIKTYNMGKLTFMYFLGGISALHINFLKTKNLNRRGAVSYGKKFLICPILTPMSDLTPFYGNFDFTRIIFQFQGFLMVTRPGKEARIRNVRFR